MAGRRSFHHHAQCLGCGPDNPATLGLRFSIEPRRPAPYAAAADGRPTPITFRRRVSAVKANWLTSSEL